MKIEIAVAINKNFLQHFYVLLESIKDYKLSIDLYTINVMHTNLEENYMTKLREIYKNEFDFRFYNLSEYNLSDLYVSAHISIETYYRILLPDILPIEIHKVLYLDCDMVVNHDLRELWEFDMNTYAVGAVFDYKAQVRKDELNIPMKYDYFNAGVLLVNLDYWRKNNIELKLLQFIRENPSKLLYWDQDALNALLYNQVAILPLRWNVQSIMLELSKQDEKLKQAKENPYIIHFTGATKPWHISSQNPFKHKYDYYLEKTPYRNFNKMNESTNLIIQKKENLFIWGAGLTGEYVYKYLNVNIRGFIDSDPSKWGTVFMGKKIFNIQEVRKLPSLGIIICSGYYREIAGILENLGFIEGEHFVHQM